MGDRAQAIWEALGRLDSARGDYAAARESFAAWSRLLPDDPRPRLVYLNRPSPAATRPRPGPCHSRSATSAAPTTSHGGCDGPPSCSASRARRAAPPTTRPRAGRGRELIDLVLINAPNSRPPTCSAGEVLERPAGPTRPSPPLAAPGNGGEAALPRLMELMVRRKQFDDLVPPRSTREAVNGAEQSAETQAWRARLLNHIGRSDDAEMILRAMAKHRPDDPGPWLALVRFQVEHRRPQAAASTVAPTSSPASGSLAPSCSRRSVAKSSATATGPNRLSTPRWRSIPMTWRSACSARHDEDTNRPARSEAV